MAESGLERAHSRLGSFLRSHESDIIADCLGRLRSLSPARELPDAAVIDHLPEILRAIADSVEYMDAGASPSLREVQKLHALDRLGRGFDLDQLVREFALLRAAILDAWESKIAAVLDVAELRNLDAAFDEFIRQSAVRYARARERLLNALDRISEAALVSADLDSFLQGLLRITLEGTESVHTCVVLLREGDTLRVRAAVGLEEEMRRTYSLSSRQGFAVHVANEGHPAFLRHAAVDPLIVSPIIREKGVRALYGVPMMREGKVIGVAHIGSLTAFEFSEEDKLLFRTVVGRATAGVVKAQLLADLRRAEAAQRFLSEASKQFAESLDYEATLGKIALLAVPTFADWCVVDLRDCTAIRRVSIAHSDPTKEQLAHELGRRYPLDPHAPNGIPHVLRTGVPEWRSNMDDEDIIARDAEHLTMLRELGMKSYIIVPITVRQEVVGAISLVSAESGRRYSTSDLALAQDLAGRAATAIDNARLYTDAQNAIEVRERVLAIVSHDLRNQLGVMLTATSLLGIKSGASTPDGAIKKTIDTIQRTAGGMQHLVDDLLDMASIQAGRLSFHPEMIELQPILKEACEAHKPLADEKDVQFESHFHVREVRVVADRRRILQVLANLLGNAIRFSVPGGTVVFRADADQAEARIVISDTGPGIPPDELETVFEPYRTIRRTGKSGTGLGLYIAKGIVQRHGGRIQVESQVGKGPMFSFTVPRAR